MDNKKIIYSISFICFHDQQTLSKLHREKITPSISGSNKIDGIFHTDGEIKFFIWKMELKARKHNQ